MNSQRHELAKAQTTFLYLRLLQGIDTRMPDVRGVFSDLVGIASVLVILGLVDRYL
ncbi:hypothetical protein [Psychroserpens mesophilus]|uniref:hypothetical protein n=1 Tax=Psychroserpens mesophilus TaxID=325473 RepID=UPI000B088AAA|nr:hypothetical protein [Psychroserpens mesophilus]